MLQRLVSVFCLCALAACTGPLGKAPTSVKVGKSYDVGGQTYTPQQDDSYNEEGIASWYGPGFHGQLTANGEAFDQNSFTAAHPTLPMPSLVEVTHLGNGKQVVVRINDRGPFVKGRIIDLSRAAARELGVQGIARVRVRYLQEATERYWAEQGLKTNAVRFSKNSPILRPETPVVSESEPTAPVLSVAQTDLAAPSGRVRPRFSVVSDAQAANVPVAKSNLHQEIDDDAVSAQKTPLKPLVDVPEASVSTPSAGGYFVQVGAFAREDNAAALAARLSSVGTAVVVRSRAASAAPLYRVHLGPEPSRNAAEALIKRLAPLGVEGRVVRQ